MSFAKWSDCHDYVGQDKRIEKAKRAENTPLNISVEEKFGKFGGSHGTYHTTLEYCECFDFKSRKMPCKHMYRLAIELGVIDADGVKEDEVKQVLKNDTAVPGMISGFGCWASTNSPGQWSRFDRSVDCIPEIISSSMQKGQFIGSGEIYDTSLLICTCRDFEERQLPCKHIYRLAVLLGVLNKDGSKGEIDADFDFPLLSEEKCEKFEYTAKLFNKYSQETLEAIRETILSSYYGLENICLDKNILVEAIGDGIVCISEDVSPLDIVKAGMQKRTVHLLTDIGFAFPETLKLQREKYAWCLENPDIVCKLIYPNAVKASLCEDFNDISAEMYSYLYYAHNIGSGINAITREVLPARVPIPEIQRLLI